MSAPATAPGGPTAANVGTRNVPRARRARHSLLRYAASRLAQGIAVLVGAMIVSFWLAHLTGNPAQVLAGTSLPKPQVQALAQRLGYGDPVITQFWHYLANVARGDFGYSYRADGPALGAVVAVLPATLLLIAGALALACAIAIPTAVFSVLRRESLADRVLRRVLMVLQGMPEFWLGLVLTLVFAVSLRWVPSLRDGQATAWILPIITLGLPLTGVLVRILRADLLDIMGQDFIVALRAKGIDERTIVVRHALRNALIPFVAVLALQTGWLFGGTIIVEAVFVWNGIGSLLLTSVSTRDVPVVQTIVVLIAAAYVVLNLFADLLAVIIDPRMRSGPGAVR